MAGTSIEPSGTPNSPHDALSRAQKVGPNELSKQLSDQQAKHQSALKLYIERNKQLEEQVKQLQMDACQSTELIEQAQKEIDHQKSLHAALQQNVDDLEARSIGTSKQPKSVQWYLKIDNTSTYGPVDINDLYEWATQCRIAPDDMLSNDNRKWIKATALPDLKMEWMTQLKDGNPYGPLNMFGIANLVADGVVAPDEILTNTKSGQEIAASKLLAPEMITAKRELDQLRRENQDIKKKNQQIQNELDATRRDPATAREVTVTPPPRSIRNHFRKHRAQGIADDQRDWVR